MLMPEFRFYRPENMTTLNELLARLKNDQLNYVFHGGGTDIMPSLKKLYRAPDAVISLSRLDGLTGIKKDAGATISIGAMTRLSDIVNDPIVKEHLSVVSQTAALIASPQIRNQGTVGGNILVDNRCKYFNQADTDRGAHGSCFKAGGDACHLIPNATRQSSPVCKARFVSDLAPVFVILDARLHFSGVDGHREIPIRKFYEPEGVNNSKTQEGEILVSVEIPLPKTGTFGYEKLRIRKAIDFPSLGVAVRKEMDGKKLKLQVCFTGVDTHPVFLEFSESDFSSRDDMLKTIEEKAARSINPIKQDFFSPKYRRKMASVFLRRLVNELG